MWRLSFCFLQLTDKGFLVPRAQAAKPPVFRRLPK